MVSQKNTKWKFADSNKILKQRLKKEVAKSTHFKNQLCYSLLQIAHRFVTFNLEIKQPTTAQFPGLQDVRDFQIISFAPLFDMDIDDVGVPRSLSEQRLREELHQPANELMIDLVLKKGV